VFRALERQVIAPHSGARVLIFGTSRGRGAFLPNRLAEGLGLPADRVLNLSIGGASIHDFLLTYERHPALLDSAETIILQADAFQFNVATNPNSRFHFYASLEDRRAYSGGLEWRLLHEWLLRVEAVSSTMALLIKGQPDPPRFDHYGRFGQVNPPNPHDEWEFRPARLEYWLTWLYGDYRYSEELERRTLAAIDRLRAHGVRVYLIRLPVVEPFERMLEAHPGDPDGAFRRRVQSVYAPHLDGIGWWEVPSAIGLEYLDYQDYGHVNDPGAEKLTAYVANWLRARAPSTHVALR